MKKRVAIFAFDNCKDCPIYNSGDGCSKPKNENLDIPVEC